LHDDKNIHDHGLHATKNGKGVKQFDSDANDDGGFDRSMQRVVNISHPLGSHAIE